jgi:hypothetical protein
MAEMGCCTATAVGPGIRPAFRFVSPPVRRSRCPSKSLPRGVWVVCRWRAARRALGSGPVQMAQLFPAKKFIAFGGDGQEQQSRRSLARFELYRHTVGCLEARMKLHFTPR